MRPSTIDSIWSYVLTCVTGLPMLCNAYWHIAAPLLCVPGTFFSRVFPCWNHCKYWVLGLSRSEYSSHACIRFLFCVGFPTVLPSASVQMFCPFASTYSHFDVLAMDYVHPISCLIKAHPTIMSAMLFLHRHSLAPWLVFQLVVAGVLVSGHVSYRIQIWDTRDRWRFFIWFHWDQETCRSSLFSRSLQPAQKKGIVRSGPSQTRTSWVWVFPP